MFYLNENEFAFTIFHKYSIKLNQNLFVLELSYPYGQKDKNILIGTQQ
jgi:hypothetical protein